MMRPYLPRQPRVSAERRLLWMSGEVPDVQRAVEEAAQAADRQMDHGEARSEEIAWKYGKEAAEVSQRQREQIDKSLREVSRVITDALQDVQPADRPAFLHHLNARLARRNVIADVGASGIVQVRAMRGREVAARPETEEAIAIVLDRIKGLTGEDRQKQIADMFYPLEGTMGSLPPSEQQDYGNAVIARVGLPDWEVFRSSVGIWAFRQRQTTAAPAPVPVARGANGVSPPAVESRETPPPVVAAPAPPDAPPVPREQPPAPPPAPPEREMTPVERRVASIRSEADRRFNGNLMRLWEDVRAERRTQLQRWREATDSPERQEKAKDLKDAEEAFYAKRREWNNLPNTELDTDRGRKINAEKRALEEQMDIKRRAWLDQGAEDRPRAEAEEAKLKQLAEKDTFIQDSIYAPIPTDAAELNAALARIRQDPVRAARVAGVRVSMDTTNRLEVVAHLPEPIRLELLRSGYNSVIRSRITVPGYVIGAPVREVGVDARAFAQMLERYASTAPPPQEEH